jgi:cysteine desulfurase
MTRRNTYMDYAAATPLDPRVLEVMLPYLTTEFGNPSSIHTAGIKARGAIEGARKAVADVLGARSDEVVFTSGATESINLAIRGLLARSPGHVVAVSTEHQATLSALEGFDVTFTTIEGVLAAIRPDTVLVTVMLANNETGAIAPVADIGRVIEKLRKTHNSSFPLLHTDATQAANYIALNVERLHVDMLSLSGSKIYGPKGTGALFVRRSVQIAPLMVGGKQESGLRAGTENVAGIVGFASAFALAHELRDSESARLTVLRDKLIDGITAKIGGAQLNGERTNRLPNNVNVAIPNVDGEELVLRLDAYGIACSTASACKGGSSPSHVLEAMGLSKERIRGSVRLSLGRQTTVEDIAYVLEVLPKVVAQMR